MAPVLIPFPDGLLLNTAMIGIIVSGRAVPTADKRLPTTPSPKFNFSPKFSTLLENMWQKNKISPMFTAIKSIKLHIYYPPKNLIPYIYRTCTKKMNKQTLI